MAEELMRAEPLDAGWAALGDGDWKRARASFEESLAKGETPEALEGMGWVGHMLNDDRLTFDARERAYRQYLERGDKGSAARIAAWLRETQRHDWDTAPAMGREQRALAWVQALAPGRDPCQRRTRRGGAAFE
jgi:hypothetical protein